MNADVRTCFRRSAWFVALAVLCLTCALIIPRLASPSPRTIFVAGSLAGGPIEGLRGRFADVGAGIQKAEG